MDISKDNFFVTVSDNEKTILVFHVLAHNIDEVFKWFEKKYQITPENVVKILFDGTSKRYTDVIISKKRNIIVSVFQIDLNAAEQTILFDI